MLESNQSFQRLEDFSPYLSCIKFFGKPIIPPLVTAKLREEIPDLRAAATRKEAYLLKRKKSNLHLPKKEKEIYYGECLPSSNISGDFIHYGQPAQYEISAFNYSNVIEFLSSPPVDSRPFENSMYVSMSKIPSSGICSTVHRGVIVSPNITDWHKNINNGAKMDAKSLKSSTIPEGLNFHLNNPDCHLCQVENRQESLVEPGVPSDNLSVEQICSVSEDEQGSLAEETEFESLPTVICGKKFSSQDTDNESSFTCLTQSTDLEKYMDCSIEYSSPDDLALTAKSQASSQLNISSRSDDASSETLVNTESELTPCASAMAELHYYNYEESSEATDPKTKAPFSVASTTPDLHQRASSVDSYMKIVKSCVSNLVLKKSHSEPSPSDISQLNLTNHCLVPASVVKNENKTSLKPKFDDGDGLKEPHDLVESSDADNPCDNTEDSNDDGKKVFKKRHIRTNSYTLDEPSTALKMAHADCNCKGNSLNPVSPHSCASEKISGTVSNPAFKKEKVNIILPPTPDRDKYFPVLSSSSSTCYPESDNTTELETSTPNATGSKISVENDSGSGSCSSIVNGEVNFVPIEISPKIREKDYISTSFEDVPENEQIVVMSSMKQDSLKNEELQSLRNELFLDIKERQQIRLQELLEEQSKQRLQLQEEFKKQDRILCAKLNLVNVSPVNDDVPRNKPQLLSRNANKCDANEKISLEHPICPNVNSFSNLNIKSACTQEILKAIPENLGDKSSEGCSDQVLENITTVQFHSSNQGTKSVSNINFPNVSDHSSFEVQSSSSVDSNSVLSSKQMQPSLSRLPSSSDNDGFKSGISEDSFERSDDIQCRVSPQSPSTLKSHLKSHSFNDSSDMHSNVQSETPQIHGCLNGGGLKVDICNFSDSLQPNDYQPSRTNSSSIKNDVSKYLQNSTYTSSHRIIPHVVTGTGFPLKDNLCKASCNCSDNSSMLNQNNSNLAINICPNSEIELLTDEGHDRTNFYLSPRKKNGTNKNLSSTYQPISNYDVMATNEKGDFSRNFLNCQHVNGLEHLNEPLTITNLNGCISMALPISPGPTHFGLLEENLNYIHYGAFKKQDRKFSFENPPEAMDFNPDKKTETKNEQYLKEHFLVQDGFNKSLKDSSSVMGNVSCHDHSKSQDFKSKADSTRVSISSTRSHSSLSRKICSKPMLSISSKSQSDSSISQNMNKTSFDTVSSSKAMAHKQIVSASLAKCKQRLNKDFVKDPAVLKKFEKLPAFVKGYLTRRLFKTERVQGLIKTLQDTAVLIGKLSEELTLKGETVSEHDVDFHRQLIVQLMTTFHSVFDIFCTISIKEKMKIISESRSLQQKKRAAEKSHDSPVPVAAVKAASAAPVKRFRLSAATLKALERKRRSTVDNRTYTIEDFKGCRPRILSSTSSKSHSSSTSRIYKSSIGLSLKRKTANVRKTQHWK